MNTTQSIEINDRVADAERVGHVRNVRGGRVLVQWTGGALEWIDLPAALARLVITPAAPILPIATTARPSRCPNPRDCGDPTCQGDCGY